MSPRARRDLAVFVLLLALGVIAVQQVKHWVHVDSVQKTLVAQLAVYHQRGLQAYRTATLRELDTLGMSVDDDALVTVEDDARDELRVELRYEWPRRVLFFESVEAEVASARTTKLDL